jgi:multidrug efflux pump subunit AcrB
MFARFFIDRPIFAWVVSLVIILGGAVAYSALPSELYPNITPPTVQVTASYPGANAEVVSNTVAAPIEQQVNGVEHMLYMSSQSANDGNYTLTVTFQIGTDVNLAQVLVQNRVALALPQLPPQVQLEGVNTKKSSPSVLLVINLISPKRLYDSVYMSNFATIQLKDELLRLDGVGDILMLGQRDYSMRLWLDPYKMATRGLTASDVISAIQGQNVQVAAGTVGQQPVPAGQAFQLTMRPGPARHGKAVRRHHSQDRRTQRIRGRLRHFGAGALQSGRLRSRRRQGRAGRPELRHHQHRGRPAVHEHGRLSASHRLATRHHVRPNKHGVHT